MARLSAPPQAEHENGYPLKNLKNATAGPGADSAARAAIALVVCVSLGAECSKPDWVKELEHAVDVEQLCTADVRPGVVPPDVHREHAEGAVERGEARHDDGGNAQQLGDLAADALALEGVGRVFGAVRAIDDVSFSVGAGERRALGVGLGKDDLRPERIVDVVNALHSLQASGS